MRLYRIKNIFNSIAILKTLLSFLFNPVQRVPDWSRISENVHRLKRINFSPLCQFRRSPFQSTGYIPFKVTKHKNMGPVCIKPSLSPKYDSPWKLRRKLKEEIRVARGFQANCPLFFRPTSVFVLPLLTFKDKNLFT